VVEDIGYVMIQRDKGAIPRDVFAAILRKSDLIGPISILIEVQC